MTMETSNSQERRKSTIIRLEAAGAILGEAYGDAPEGITNVLLFACNKIRAMLKHLGADGDFEISKDAEKNRALESVKNLALLKSVEEIAVFGRTLNQKDSAIVDMILKAFERAKS